MDASRQYQIDQWITANVYGFFERCMQAGKLPTPQEAQAIAPLLQMYQAMQLEDIQEELQMLSRLFLDGNAVVYLTTNSSGLDVNIVDNAEPEPKKPARRKPL